MSNLENIPKQSLYNGSVASPINSTQTTGIIIQPLIGFNPTPGEKYRLSILNPDGAEIIEFEDQNPNGELTGVVRGLELADGTAGVARAHGAGIRVTLSNPFQLYEDIQTAINSKVDIDEGTAEKLTVEDWIELQSYANAAARDAAITSPTKDMVVILDNDGDGKRAFSVYNGTSWQQIAAPLRDPEFSGYVRFPRYADDTARDAAIPSPQVSMVVYNTSAVTLQLFDGSNWIDLDIGTPVPLATTSTPGRVRLATDAQVLAGTDDISGDPLVVQPSQIKFGETLEVVSGVAMTAGQLVGVYNGIINTNPIVGPAAPSDSVLIKQNLPNSGTAFVRIINISGNNYIILYRATNELRAVVATFDGVTLSYGTSILISSDVTSTELADLALLSSTRAVVNYSESATLTVLRHRVISISGTSLSEAGAVTTFTASSNIREIQNCSPTTNLGAVSIACTTNTDHRTMAYTLSGTTLTVGAAVTIFSGTSLSSISLVSEKIRNDAYAIFFNSTVIACTISGTTVTAGSAQGFEGDIPICLRIIWLSDNNIAFQFIRTTGSSVIGIRGATISGTTFTFGTSVTFGSGQFCPCVRVSSTEIGVEQSGTYNLYTYSAGSITFASTVYSGRTSLTLFSVFSPVKKSDFILSSNLSVLGLASIPTLFFWSSLVTGLSTATNSSNVIGTTTEPSTQGATTFISLRGKLMRTPGATRVPGGLYRITSGAITFVAPTTNVSNFSAAGQYDSLCNKFIAVSQEEFIFT